MTDGVVERLAAEARRSGVFLSPTEIADVLFLIAESVSPPAAVDPEPVVPVAPADEPVAPDVPPDVRDEVAPPLEPEPPTPVVPVVPVAPLPPPMLDLWPPTSTALPDALPIRVPAAPSVARLEMTRALRPLRRRVPIGLPGTLDAEATAHRAAETDLLYPIFQPYEERWLDVAVVVDEAASMAVSKQTVDDLTVVLTDLGAFRGIHLWHFDGGDPTAAIRVHGPQSSVPHRPDELLDAARRRVILVVSDCLGAAWHDGRMGDALESWGKSGPVAIVQPLPQRLWETNAPPSHAVKLTAVGPGTANRDLAVSFTHRTLDLTLDPAESSRDPLGVAVPMIEFGLRWLARWAALVAGDSSEFHGRVVFTDQMRGPRSITHPPAPVDSDELLARFVGTASPQAQRLAIFLAAAAPLTLPIMHLVQTAAFPEAPPTALREVFLGNLLRREPRFGESVTPNDVVYDFAPRVRKQLIGSLTEPEAMTVLLAVSRYLAERLGSSFDFLALLANRQTIGALDKQSRAFATVAAEVLEWMGGTYREQVRQLKRILAGDTPGASGPDNDTLRNPGESPERGETVDKTMVERSDTDFASPGVVNVPNSSAHAPLQTSSGTARQGPVGWETVPARNANFVGRTDTLDRMRDMLVNSSRTAVLLPRALYGLGGVGKTQLAIEYVHRFADEYNLVWWIAAEDPAEIRRSLVDLAAFLEIPVTEDSGQTIARVHEALRRRRPFQRWLLVFDNVGEPDKVESLIPPADGGHVLVTTRIRAWEQAGQAVEVDKFRRQESVALLQAHGGMTEIEADLVAGRVDDLPISLAQAAAWRSETKRSVAEYVELFDADLAERGEEADPEGYSSRAAAAMSLAFERLRAATPLAARLLQLVAYFGPEWISVDLLHRGRLATPLSRALGGVLRDQAPLARAVRDIARWELARNDTRTQRFQVHRLVQYMLQEEMEPQQRQEIRTTVQTMLAFANPGNPDRIPLPERAKHAELSAHIVASGLIESDEEEARQAVLDQIRYRLLVGDYDSSQELAEQALASWRGQDTGSADDTYILLARRFIANAMLARGEAVRAIAIYQSVLDKFTALLGPEHEHTMATVNSLCGAYRATGLFTEARRLDEQNFESQSRLLGEEDRITLRAANNLAVDLRMAGEYEKALDLDQRTHTTSVRVYGPNDRDTLFRLANVARDLYALGRYPEALQRQREALSGLEAILGLDHPNVLGVRRLNLIILRKLGRRSETATAAEALLLAHQNRLGSDHPDTLLVRQSLFNALRDNREVARAVAEGAATLQRYRALYPEHPFAQVCAVNLAIVLRQAGKVTEARALNETALGALTAVFGADHPYTLCCSTNLASDLAAGREPQAALELSGATLDRSRRVRGIDQPYTLACQVNHAIDLTATGDESTGRTELDRAVTLMRNNPNLGEASPDLELALEGKRIDCDIEPPPT